jgi:hypothetical protein
MREDVTGVWGKLHNEGLNDLYLHNVLFGILNEEE